MFTSVHSLASKSELLFPEEGLSLIPCSNSELFVVSTQHPNTFRSGRGLWADSSNPAPYPSLPRWLKRRTCQAFVQMSSQPPPPNPMPSALTATFLKHNLDHFKCISRHKISQSRYCRHHHQENHLVSVLPKFCGHKVKHDINLPGNTRVDCAGVPAHWAQHRAAKDPRALLSITMSTCLSE